MQAVTAAVPQAIPTLLLLTFCCIVLPGVWIAAALRNDRNFGSLVTFLIVAQFALGHVGLLWRNPPYWRVVWLRAIPWIQWPVPVAVLVAIVAASIALTPWSREWDRASLGVAALAWLATTAALGSVFIRRCLRYSRPFTSRAPAGLVSTLIVAYSVSILVGALIIVATRYAVIQMVRSEFW